MSYISYSLSPSYPHACIYRTPQPILYIPFSLPLRFVLIYCVDLILFHRVLCRSILFCNSPVGQFHGVFYCCQTPYGVLAYHTDRYFEVELRLRNIITLSSHTCSMIPRSLVSQLCIPLLNSIVYSIAWFHQSIAQFNSVPCCLTNSSKPSHSTYLPRVGLPPAIDGLLVPKLADSLVQKQLFSWREWRRKSLYLSGRALEWVGGRKMVNRRAKSRTSLHF